MVQLYLVANMHIKGMINQNEIQNVEFKKKWQRPHKILISREIIFGKLSVNYNVSVLSFKMIAVTNRQYKFAYDHQIPNRCDLEMSSHQHNKIYQFKLSCILTMHHIDNQRFKIFILYINSLLNIRSRKKT